MADQATLHLKMASPSEVLFEMDVVAVVAPTINGDIKILPRHTPVVSVLKAGALVVTTKEGEQKPYFVAGGFVEVANNQVIVLADEAEHVHDLDQAEVEEAVRQAEELLADKNFEAREYEVLQANLQKERARVSTFTKWRK